MDIVIGAGVTGLAYANFTHNPFLIIEADNHTGGLCYTIKQDGFIWDYSGHFFHFQDPLLADLFKTRMNEDELVCVEKHTQIMYKDRYVDFPFQKNIHQLEFDEFIDCLCDLFESDSVAISSFKSMLYSRFGKSIAEKFLIPYNEKLYATDLDKLDANAMGRFFPYADKEDIIRNFRHKSRDSYNGSFIYPRGGAIEYIKALESAIPHERISLNERAEGVDIEKHILKTNKRLVGYDNLISTIPLVDFLRLCRIGYDTEALSWNKVLVFNLGFDGPSEDRVNHWLYFPESKYCFYRVGFYNNIIPSDRMSLYVELGFPHDRDVDIELFLERVLFDLKKAGIVSNQKLVSNHSVIMNPAYVHVNKKGIDEVTRIKKILSSNDIYSIGRYGSWNYSSIEDNMKEAISLTNKL